LALFANGRLEFAACEKRGAKVAQLDAESVKEKKVSTAHITMLHTPRMEVSDARQDVESHAQSGPQWRRLMGMLGNELANAAQRSELQAERVDASTVLFEAEAREDLRVVAEVGIDGGLPGQIVFAVISADVVFSIPPDLVAFEDGFVVGCRHVARGSEAKQFIRHRKCRCLYLKRVTIWKNV
jgi:hypothetical protein